MRFVIEITDEIVKELKKRNPEYWAKVVKLNPKELTISEAYFLRMLRSYFDPLWPYMEDG